MTRSLRELTACTVVAAGLGAGTASAQTPPAPLTLAGAIDMARTNYPALAERRARELAAAGTIDVARAAYLPRLDVLWQGNRATRNNVFGLLLPQSIVPPISGPVLGTTSYDSVWSSAAGVLLSWQAVDFGLRKANIDAARAQTSLASAQTALSDLDVAAAAVDAFLTVLASDESVRVARANVDRLQVLNDSVRTLVQNQLRPGADQSRAEAELAIARNQFSQAAQSASIARAALAAAVGSAGTSIEPDTSLLAKSAGAAVPLSTDLNTHPAARTAVEAVAAAQARARIVDRSYWPHVDVQSAFAGRGSGAPVPGLPPPGDGLALQVPNWALGVSVTFPAFEVFTARARQRVEMQNEAAERAHYQQTLQNLTTERLRARALMTAADEIARNAPIEHQAAEEAETRARARYSSGLANLVEVAEAERVLAQAEADDALARLAVWRARLADAQAAGDLRPFLDAVR